MDKYEEIKDRFEKNADKEKAEKMSKYMKNLFVFYGIETPKRRMLYKDIIKAEKKEKKIDWEFLDKCYDDEYREFQYVSNDYLFELKKYTVYEDIDKIKEYITAKSWWDTIDCLCRVIGDIGLRDKRVENLMTEWSENENIWIKRTAILHQLGYKDKTNCVTLEKIIVNCFGSDEFFVNKAIGWALREYSKTDKEWIGDFIGRYKERMNGLSVREGSKYI